MSEIVSNEKSSDLRKSFIESFVDTSTEYYKELSLMRPTDIALNSFVSMYLSDTLYSKYYNAVSCEEAIRMVSEKESVYSMWDIRPSKIVYDESYPFPPALCPHYLEVYNSDTVIKWDADELTALLTKELLDYSSYDCTVSPIPEDIYIFDGSFKWCVIFTHSPTTLNGNKRLCYACIKNA